MPWRRMASRPGEQAEPIVQPSGNVFNGECLNTRRRELQRQRNPVEPTANAGDHLRVVRGEGEAWARLARPIDKQLDRFALSQRLPGTRQRERRSEPGTFTGNA